MRWRLHYSTRRALRRAELAAMGVGGALFLPQGRGVSSPAFDRQMHHVPNLAKKGCSMGSNGQPPTTSVIILMRFLTALMLFAATPVVEEYLVNGPMRRRMAIKMHVEHDVPNRQRTKVYAWGLKSYVLTVQMNMPTP